MAFSSDNTNATAAKDKEPKKGQEVKILSGKYEGKKAWINVNKGNKGETPKKIHLILRDGNKERLTCLMKTSIALRDRKPTCFEEAIMDQHPDILGLMVKLTRALAECELPEDKSMKSNLAHIFIGNLDKAIFEQDALGHKAKWRKVQWATREEEILFEEE